MDRPGVRTRSIPFIRWAAARRLIADLTIDHPPSQLPGEFQVEDIHREELRRCLNDTSLPLEVRITGALIRLYALSLTRIVELTADQFHRDDDKNAYLTINRHPVVLPPKLARLIEDQLREPPHCINNHRRRRGSSSPASSPAVPATLWDSKTR